jgi:hypothetical protein
MLRRCHNEKDPYYADYGGRGIVVADEWRGRGGFEAFYAHVGPRPGPKYHIDRRDNDRGYAPGNVRWVDHETSLGNRRTSMTITIDGVTKHLAAWCREYNIRSSTVRSRIEDGWSPEAAITTPRRGNR